MSLSTGTSLLDTSLAVSELRLKRKDAALHELVHRTREVAALGDADVLCETLLLRERLGSTAIGKGVALPNARSITVSEPRLIFGRSTRGIDWRAADELPVRLVFLVVSPGESSLELHHEWLARAAAFARLIKNRQRLLDAADAAAMKEVLREVAW
jgi:mannitol/fructose-specific phosphotransferase system IIA component (Ntr-type)